MQRDTVRIYDTTLRDGLRNSGIVMTIEQKLAFVRQLEALNVDAIEMVLAPAVITALQISTRNAESARDASCVANTT